MTKRRKPKLWDFELGTLDHQTWEDPHWMNEESEYEFSRHREALAEQAAQWQERQMSWARNSLKTAAQRARSREVNRRNNMVQKGLLPILRSVMQSWGLNIPVVATTGEEPSGWTDFRSINIVHRKLVDSHFFVGDEAKPISDEEIRAVVGETRGLFYHEVGHNLFTVPLPYLWLMAWDKKLSFDLPGLETGAPRTRENLAAMVPNSVRVDKEFQHAWNVLEDCRMESRLVIESPAVAKYLTLLVLRNIAATSGGWDHNGMRTFSQAQASNYPLVGGRKYLPKAVREAAAVRWDAEWSQVETAANVEALIDRYVTAKDPRAMLEATSDMRQLLLDLRNASGGFPAALDDHKFIYLYDENMSSKHEPDEDMKSKIKGVGNANGKNQSKGPQEAKESPSGTLAESGDGEGDRDLISAADYSDLVDQARMAATEAVENDSTTQGDVQDLNTAYNEDDGKLGYYGHVSIAKGNWNEDAGKLADEIEQAFRTATAHSSPVWASGQTAGILEPIRFRTRQPGDREFYRTYADEGEPGQDLAVTLMLDVSGSMSGTGPALGAAAYAVKRAGDALSIDTEVAVFESNPHLIWAADDRPDCVPEIGATGSTYPAELFQALLTERRDKAKHIVIIMTDGGWGGSGQPDVDLRTYAEDNRFIVLLGYGLSKAVENLMERGPDEAYHITDLFEIPALLENILVAMV